MQLSKRLQAVANLVTPGNRVADVGCDHAYTSIYLAKSNKSPLIIAMDVNQGPIDRAKENIEKYLCKDKIETRKSDGLQNLQIGEVDTILIAGMGGQLTISILTERMEVMNSVRELILQPQSEINKVRQFLQKHEYYITNENMMKEDGKYYVMMKAIHKNYLKDTVSYMLTKEEHYYYGRLLLEIKNSTLIEFLLWDLSLCEDIRDNLHHVHSDHSQLRLKEIEERINLIRVGLGYYADENQN